MSGERECATGCPQTKARGCSAINGSDLSEFCKQRQQGQPDNGEVIALDPLEKLDSLAFYLISAHAFQCLAAHARQVPSDEAWIEPAHRHTRDRHMPPDRLAAPGENHRGVEMMRVAR